MLLESFGFANLLTALDHLGGILIVFNREQKIVYYNARFKEIIDFDDDMLMGMSLDYLVEEGYFVNSASKKVFETGEAITHYITGKMLTPTLAISTPILDADGRVEYVVNLSLGENAAELVSKTLHDAHLQSQQIDYLSKNIFRSNLVFTQNRELLKIFALLERVSPTDSTILLTGETGTGKEVMARYIHEHSLRKDKIFIPINCASIPENLVESELFGYEPGAFTGAKKNGKLGTFELASGGTLFLDEIGDMPLSVQSKFLRVLETGQITRVGGEKARQVDIRLVAATNKDLAQMCREKTFRSDLYYRLNVLGIKLPPLRERPEDILPLAFHFLRKLNAKYGYEKSFSTEAKEQLLDYSWPGNVRELRNEVERMAMLSSTSLLEPDPYLSNTAAAPLHETAAAVSQPLPEIHYQSSLSLKDMMSQYEQIILREALAAHDGNVQETADALQIHKTGLYRKMEKYEITRESVL